MQMRFQVYGVTCSHSLVDPDLVSPIDLLWSSTLPHSHSLSTSLLILRFLCRIKALLFTLIRAFEFELAIPASEIGKKISPVVVQRPVLINDPQAGNQMPMLVKPHVRVD